jgi:hypothetical protein
LCKFRGAVDGIRFHKDGFMSGAYTARWVIEEMESVKSLDLVRGTL